MVAGLQKNNLQNVFRFKSKSLLRGIDCFNPSEKDLGNRLPIPDDVIHNYS